LSGGSPFPPTPPPKERLNAVALTHGPTQVICDLVQGHQYCLKRERKRMDTEMLHRDSRGGSHRGGSTFYPLMERREGDMKI